LDLTIDQVHRIYERDAALDVVTLMKQGPEGTDLDLGTDLTELKFWPATLVRDGITEHVDEDGLGEGVEFGDGLTAFGSERIGRIQHRRNPPLLLNRRQRDRPLAKGLASKVKDPDSAGLPRKRTRGSLEAEVVE
jgi:hypothetical protein